MGGALAGAAARAVGGDAILTADRHPEKLSALQSEYGTVPASVGDAARESRFVFLGAKPQGMRALLDEVRDASGDSMKEHIYVSMAAGWKISLLSELLGSSKVIRILPNLAVSAGSGVILYDTARDVSGEEEKEFLALMSAAGISMKLPEEKIDAGCAVAGCGPAFVCLLMEAMTDAGVRCGLSPDVSRALTLQTFLGTADVLKKSGEDPASLRIAVCSPAGSTIDVIPSQPKNAKSPMARMPSGTAYVSPASPCG